MNIEVRTARGWKELRSIPSVKEDSRIEFRGIPSGSTLALAGLPLQVLGGTAGLSLYDHPDLRGHVGLAVVTVDDAPAGEIDVVPGKLSLAAWNELRADLQATWAGLLFDDSAAASLRGQFTTWPPDVNALWRDIAPVIADLDTRPVETLTMTERWVRRERARRPSEFSHAVVLAGARGRPGRARALGSVPSEPERALVRDCLRRLHAMASRDVNALPTADSIGRFLAGATYGKPASATPVVTHLARHEPRLRQVVALRQKLLNPVGVITEGPGELRLGIKGLDRLYEYWVFLMVLRSLQRQFGPPLGRGFEDLAVRLPGNRMRLVLPEGTTIRFPGGVSAVFTPTITPREKDSWLQLELVPLPGNRRSAGLATPDIVVLKEFENGSAAAVVLDAKYRARVHVDGALWEIYEKYARIRRHGRTVVTEVIAAHPNIGLDLSWAGQRAVPFVPLCGPPEGLWPADWSIVATQPTLVAAEDRPGPVVEAAAAGSEAPAPDLLEPPRPALHPDVATSVPGAVEHSPLAPVSPLAAIARPAELVICDQQWTANAVGQRRLDLIELRTALAPPEAVAAMVGSAVGPRKAFLEAARHRGWLSMQAEERTEVLAAVERLVQEHAPGQITVVTGYRDLVGLLRSLGVPFTIVDDVSHFI